jgi:toxin FitB
MYLLDTNVLSAMMGRQPEPAVAAWVAARPEEELCTAAVCQAEILAGIAVLPDGRRQRQLEAAAQAIFDEDFDGRILPFDAMAATLYAALYAARKRAGRSTATADLMIAAVARASEACMVTRDIDGFEGCGLTFINPWRTVG